MSETKFTPGPWSPMWQNSREKSYGGGIRFWEIPVCVGEWPNVGNPICIVHMGGPGATSSTKNTVEPNAHLIAAAPDLYEATKLALREAENWIHDQLDGTGDVDDALAELEPVRVALAKARGEAS